MTRCYFNFRQGPSYSVDEEGCDFDTVEDAYLAAVRASQDMWRELLIRREDPRDCAFEVRDARGNELFTLPFSEVLEACAHQPSSAPYPVHRSAIAHALENRRIAAKALSDFSSAMKSARATLHETIGLLDKVGKIADR